MPSLRDRSLPRSVHPASSRRFFRLNDSCLGNAKRNCVFASLASQAPRAASPPERLNNPARRTSQSTATRGQPCCSSVQAAGDVKPSVPFAGLRFKEICQRLAKAGRLNTDRRPRKKPRDFSQGFLKNRQVSPNLLDRFHHVFNHFLGIAKHHHGFVHVEQLIVQTSVAGVH